MEADTETTVNGSVDAEKMLMRNGQAARCTGTRLSKKDVILNSIQNLLPLIKAGDQSVDGHSTGSGSGMTKSWSSFEFHILFGQPPEKPWHKLQAWTWKLNT